MTESSEPRPLATVLCDCLDHAVDGFEAEVERVKDRLRKRAREEITPIPAIYNDAIVDIASEPNSECIAAKLPTYPSVK